MSRLDDVIKKFNHLARPLYENLPGIPNHPSLFRLTKSRLLAIARKSGIQKSTILCSIVLLRETIYRKSSKLISSNEETL